MADIRLKISNDTVLRLKSCGLTNSEINKILDALTPEIDIKADRRELVGKKTDKGEVFNNYKANSAKGYYAHAEGDATEAEGDASHAEGYKSLATKGSAHAEGCECKATNESSHAEGMWTEASGYISHSEGVGTKATGDIQHVQGKYNKEDPTMALIVGNGSSEDNRSNVHTLDWDGNAWFAGEVTVGEERKKLITEKELDDIVGDIDKVLDEIITLQVLHGGTNFLELNGNLPDPGVPPIIEAGEQI